MKKYEYFEGLAWLNQDLFTSVYMWKKYKYIWHSLWEDWLLQFYMLKYPDTNTDTT